MFSFQKKRGMITMPPYFYYSPAITLTVPATAGVMQMQPLLVPVVIAKLAVSSVIAKSLFAAAAIVMSLVA
jgi:hypothetical protein